MRCPFCDTEMKSGTLCGDGRSKVRWFSNEEYVNIVDKVMGKGVVDANYSLARFEIPSDYCPKCKKMIFDTEVSN